MTSAIDPPNSFPCRPVGIGPLAVEIVSDDDTARLRFDHLLAAFPDPIEGATVVHVALSGAAASEGIDPLYDSDVDGRVLAHAMTLGEQEFRITRHLNERKLDAEPQLLHLHGGAVARGDEALLLVGSSGSGKSTLTAALVRAGWTYLTDEMVTLDPADGRVTPYPRPITLREGSWASFAELEADTSSPGWGNRDPAMEVPPLELGGSAQGERFEVAGLLWPRYSPDAEPTLRPLDSAAEAVHRLTECCYDLERLGPSGFDLLVEVAARGAAWELVYNDTEWARTRAESALDLARSGPRVAARRLPNAGRAADGSPCKATDVEGWAFGDGSAVLFRPASLALVRLDADGVLLWGQLDRGLTVDELAEAVGAVEAPAHESLDQWLSVMHRAGFITFGED